VLEGVLGGPVCVAIRYVPDRCSCVGRGQGLREFLRRAVQAKRLTALRASSGTLHSIPYSPPPRPPRLPVLLLVLSLLLPNSSTFTLGSCSCIPPPAAALHPETLPPGYPRPSPPTPVFPAVEHS
jgi:hypothetical protein